MAGTKRRAGTAGGGAAKPVLLTIETRHGDAAPDFKAQPGDYISYFENEHGEQWVFIRHRDADRATVYGGDLGWEPVEIYERTPEQLRQDTLAAGGRPGTLDRVLSLIDPLAPSVILSDSERTWLNNVWHTSGTFGPGDPEASLSALGRSLAARYATPDMARHANSAEHRAAMQSFCLIVGREAGRCGLTDNDTARVLKEALEALPKPR